MRSSPGAAVRIALAGAVTCAWLSAPSASAAAPLSAALSVERGPGADDCPEVASLARIIARIVEGDEGADALLRPDGEVRAAVRFSRTAATYEATLRLSGKREGERTLTDTGPTCTALGRAVGITMALLLDAGLDAPPERAVAPVADVATLAVPRTPAPAPRATEGTLAVAVGPALGLVGGPALATTVGVAVGIFRRAKIALDGQYVAARATAFGDGEVDVALLAARLRVCGVVNDGGRFSVDLCAAGAAGQLHGEGRGYPTADAQTLAWRALGGGVAVTRAWGRFRLSLAADALAPLRKSTFSVTNLGVGYRSSPVSATLALGVGVALW